MPVGNNSTDQLDTADQTCPYSKAIRGNIDVAINLI
jgi:organic hydroperoxide reductase OsmC/OhrA